VSQKTDHSETTIPPVSRANTQVSKVGRIIIGRHGRPDKDRELGPRLTATQYLAWWASYEEASLKDNGQGPSKRLLEETGSAPFINTSIRPRAIQTAQAISQGREVRQNAIFIEAPLPPPNWPDFWRFLPKRWNVISRVSWCFGFSGGQESQKEARIRADEASDVLIAQAESGHDSVLAAHGWFNRMMRPELKRKGWKCTYDGGDSYWSFRIYEKHS